MVASWVAAWPFWRGGSVVVVGRWREWRERWACPDRRWPRGVERQAADSPVARDALRAQQARPIVGRIQAWAFAQRVLPQSSLGKAVAYMLGLWPGLTRFLEDARIPLDNNATERALRGAVVGRGNHHGSRSRRGTEVAALFYSLLETAKRVAVEPKTYLRSAIDVALSGQAVLLPHQLAG